MPRMKSVTSIEAKIALAQEKLLAAEARYNAWAEKLLALQKEKEEVQAANIAAALRTSRKTYQEMMTFLGWNFTHIGTVYIEHWDTPFLKHWDSPLRRRAS